MTNGLVPITPLHASISAHVNSFLTKVCKLHLMTHTEIEEKMIRSMFHCTSLLISQLYGGTEADNMTLLWGISVFWLMICTMLMFCDADYILSWYLAEFKASKQINPQGASQKPHPPYPDGLASVFLHLAQLAVDWRAEAEKA